MTNGEWVDQRGEIFRFENDGDTIIGTLKAIRDGRYARLDRAGNVLGKSKVYSIQKEDDNKLYTVFGTTVLERSLSEKNIGNKVKIVFKGTQKTAAGMPMKMFDVLIQAEAQA